MRILKYDFKLNRLFLFAVSVGVSMSILMLCIFLGKGASDEEAQSRVINLITMIIFNGGIGMIGIIVYIIITNCLLVSSMVDNGTIANFLSTPIKRTTFTFIQSIYSVLSLLFIDFVITIFYMIGLAMRGFDVNVGAIFMFGFGTFIFHLMCAGICFLVSCIFSKSSLTMGISGGIFGVFTILNMMVVYGGSSVKFLNYFKYINIFTLYDIDGFMSLSSSIWWKVVIMAIIGISSYIAGNVFFNKKDLFV